MSVILELLDPKDCSLKYAGSLVTCCLSSYGEFCDERTAGAQVAGSPIGYPEVVLPEVPGCFPPQ